MIGRSIYGEENGGINWWLKENVSYEIGEIFYLTGWGNFVFLVKNIIFKYIIWLSNCDINGNGKGLGSEWLLKGYFWYKNFNNYVCYKIKDDYCKSISCCMMNIKWIMSFYLYFL